MKAISKDMYLLQYEHRVEFRNISKENREMLIKYIFQEERKIRKNNR